MYLILQKKSPSRNSIASNSERASVQIGRTVDGCSSWTGTSCIRHQRSSATTIREYSQSCSSFRITEWNHSNGTWCCRAATKYWSHSVSHSCPPAVLWCLVFSLLSDANEHDALEATETPDILPVQLNDATPDDENEDEEETEEMKKRLRHSDSLHLFRKKSDNDTDNTSDDESSISASLEWRPIHCRCLFWRVPFSTVQFHQKKSIRLVILVLITFVQPVSISHLIDVCINNTETVLVVVVYLLISAIILSIFCSERGCVTVVLLQTLSSQFVMITRFLLLLLLFILRIPHSLSYSTQRSVSLYFFSNCTKHWFRQADTQKIFEGMNVCALPI